MTAATSQLEDRIRSAFDARALGDAARATLEAYGSELFAFLCSRLRSQSDAQEVFAMFAEDLWVGLPDFGWRCSMRTWAYTLARNAAARYAVAPQQHAIRNLSISQVDGIAELVDRARSETDVFRRTEVKDRFKALYDQLDDENQMLLVLRVERGMSWRDLALTLRGDPDLDEDSIAKESARLRKAFERLKAELRTLAEREGLFES